MLLCFFKYKGIARAIVGINNVYMPLGLSFFLFKSIGYCVDVYRKEIDAEQNLLRYALFVSYFPALIEGPISSYNQLASQLFQNHEYNYDNCKFGIQRIVWGVFKKLVIANQINTIIAPISRNYESMYGIYILFGLFLYSIWLYADFSGFIDIAIGTSQLLGIEIQENFNTPYFSKSISEYWRRWHISLGTWFQKYLFYPLLRTEALTSVRKSLKKRGNKSLSKNVPVIIALLVTWLLIGIWHGSNICFPLYGLYYGIIMTFSFLFDTEIKNTNNLNSRFFYSLCMIRTYVLVLAGYLLFWPANFHITKVMFQHLFTSNWLSRDFILYLYQNIREILIVIPACLILFSVELYHYRSDVEKQAVGVIRANISEFNVFFKYTLYVGIILAILIFGNYGSGVSNQFAYFRF